MDLNKQGKQSQKTSSVFKDVLDITSALFTSNTKQLPQPTLPTNAISVIHDDTTTTTNMFQSIRNKFNTLSNSNAQQQKEFELQQLQLCSISSEDTKVAEPTSSPTLLTHVISPLQISNETSDEDVEIEGSFNLQHTQPTTHTIEQLQGTMQPHAAQLLNEFLGSCSRGTTTSNCYSADQYSNYDDQNSKIDDNINLDPDVVTFTQLQPVPVAEAGPLGQSSQSQPQPTPTQQIVPPQSAIKFEKPLTFDGKHKDTENFIFSMQAYTHAVSMTDRQAAEFLTLYLRGDAMTWWRSFCVSNGGLNVVFQNSTFQNLLDLLRDEFSDVDRLTVLRNKLFNLKQHHSVQAYVTLFRTTMIDLGSSQVDPETAKHLFLHGLKAHIKKEVFMHRPQTFDDMILLAERADQAFQANERGLLNTNKQQYNNNRPNYTNPNKYKQQQQHQQQQYKNSSQYSNSPYKGPSPMVLGNTNLPVCYHCGKPGHLKRDCYKLQNEQSRAQGAPMRGNGRAGGRGRGRSTFQHNSATIDEALKLGLAALASKETQSKKVTFEEPKQGQNSKN